MALQKSFKTINSKIEKESRRYENTHPDPILELISLIRPYLELVLTWAYLSGTSRAAPPRNFQQCSRGGHTVHVCSIKESVVEYTIVELYTSEVLFFISFSIEVDYFMQNPLVSVYICKIVGNVPILMIRTGFVLIQVPCFNEKKLKIKPSNAYKNLPSVSVKISRLQLVFLCKAQYYQIHFKLLQKTEKYICFDFENFSNRLRCRYFFLLE